VATSTATAGATSWSGLRGTAGAATHSGRLDVFYLHPVVGPLAGPSIFGTSTNEFRTIDGNADMDADGIPDIVTAPDVFTGRRFCVYSGADLRRTVSITSDAASLIEDIPASSLTSIADLNGDGPGVNCWWATPGTVRSATAGGPACWRAGIAASCACAPRAPARRPTRPSP
jgi:hypothetical protein